MTAVASQDVPSRQHQLARRLRAAVLGPRGGGTTRRRASDAFRVGVAIAVVAVSIPVMRANSAVELSIVHALTPPPTAIKWLITSVFWLGSAGLTLLLVIVGLLVPRLAAVRWTALAGLLTWGVCALLQVFLGPAAGRPPTAALAGVSTSYPVIQLAVTIAVVATALPYLSRPVHRLVSFLVAVAALAAVSGGYALPVNAVSSLVLGWGMAAALHLAVGSPLGLPSATEVTEWVADLNLTVKDITRSPGQVWGSSSSPARTRRAGRSSWPSMAETHPTPGCWRNSGGSACTGTRDPPSPRCSSNGSSRPTCPPSGAGSPWSGCAAANTYDRDGTELIGQASKSPWTLDTHRGTCSRPASSPDKS